MLLDTVVYTIANGNFLGAFLSFMISAPLEAKTVEAAGSSCGMTERLSPTPAQV